MIKVVMFDLGDTLIDAAHRPLPHVKEALAAIARLKTAAGKPLRSCLVSDWPTSTPAPPAAELAAIWREYLAVLEQAGLRPLFEPVQKRITLSAHAGVMKPDHAVFEKALRRLGSRAGLDECMLITENPAHIRHARTVLGMAALQFRSAQASRFDFDDWSQAPALIAHALAAPAPANMQLAVRAFLAARQIDLLSAEDVGADGQGRFSGSLWTPVAVPGRRDLKDLHASVPVSGRIVRSKKGALKAVGITGASAPALEEAASFVRSLAANGQIAGAGGAPPQRPTHEVQTDATGVRRLVRRGYSAV